MVIHRLSMVLLCVWALLPAPLATEVLPVTEIGELDPQLEQIGALRGEIADNLRTSARGEGLAHPIRIYRYQLKKGEHFFTVMAKVSQNADTLVTLNRIPNPEAIGPGERLIIPNARGLFVDGDDATEIAKRYGVSERVLIRCEGRWFIPGGRLPNSELALFRGSGFRYPLRFRRISSHFGTRIDPFTRRATFHGGIDLAAPAGTGVAASRGGVVVSAGVSGGYGQLVVIEHEHGYSTYYGHLSRISVKPGQFIREGEPLGTVGSTGRSTGPHLHFEVRKNGFRRRPELIGYLK